MKAVRRDGEIPTTIEGITEGTAMGTSEHSLSQLMGHEDSETSIRCWQGEEEVEDRWGFGSPAETGAECSTVEGFEGFGHSKSGRRRSIKLHRASRRVFSCFRRGSINLMVPDLTPSTPPRGSGPISAPRTSNASGAAGFTFMDDAIDQQTDDEEDHQPEEPTSPVVNCLGQVRAKELKCIKKVETPRERDDNEKLQRTKSRAPAWEPQWSGKGKPCKSWKHLIRSSSSSISPSSQPLAENEIDLGRFSSSSCSSEPFFRHVAAASHCEKEKLPDKTAMLFRMRNGCQANPTNQHEGTDKMSMALQHELDERGESGSLETTEQSEVVPNKLSSLKAMKIESPKWCADEPHLSRTRRAAGRSSRLDLKRESPSRLI